MNGETLIAPTTLRDYALSHGWSLVREAAKDRLYVLTHPHFERRQLVFPMDTTAPDYSDAVTLVVDKLSTLEQRSHQEVYKGLFEVGDDSIAFRVTTPQSEQRSLRLAFAGSILAGAQQLLLASACTALRPQTHHPRLSRAEAQQFLETIQFRHTEPGSFVLNVSCPVHGIDLPPSLLNDDDEAPFVRRTTQALMRTLREVVTSIETDSLDELISTAKKGMATILTPNFCDALMCLEDQSLRNSVEIGFTWAGCIPRPATEPRISVVRIQHDYFAKIEGIRRELLSKEPLLEDAFPGTVERLDGEMGQGGKRSGEVILSLLLPDGEQVRARASLDTQQYELADKAHMTDGAYVKVTGKLHPGRPPRKLSTIKSFELMLK